VDGGKENELNGQRRKIVKIQKNLYEKKVITFVIISPPKITKVITFGTGLVTIPWYTILVAECFVCKH
jgi:hypothetical protein